MRRKHRLFVPPLVAVAHLGLLALMLRTAPIPPLEPSPVMTISLMEGLGAQSGDAPGSASGSPSEAAQSSQAAAVEAAAAAAPASAPPPPSEATPPAQAESSLDALPAPAQPPAPPTPDFSADPTEADVTGLADLLAQASPSAEAGVAVAAAGGLGGGAGDSCRLAEWLQNVLATDPEVVAALARVPPASRSVANALMLWDGRWVATLDRSGADLMAPVRRRLVEGLLAAPEGCREDLIQGPRFIAVAEPQPATVLAVGSGIWRWSDLLQGPLMSPDDGRAASPPGRRVSFLLMPPPGAN